MFFQLCPIVKRANYFEFMQMDKFAMKISTLFKSFWVLESSGGEKSINVLHLLTKFSSVQFSRSVVSDSLRPLESQHARPPCPSPTPGVYSNSSPSSRWCHPANSSSVVPFSSCLQSLPASGSFPIKQNQIAASHRCFERKGFLKSGRTKHKKTDNI